MLRAQVREWFTRHGWMVYAVMAAAFLANIIVQVAAVNRGDDGPATIPALVFSVIAFVCAVVVGAVLFRGRTAR